MLWVARPNIWFFMVLDAEMGILWHHDNPIHGDFDSSFSEERLGVPIERTLESGLP